MQEGTNAATGEDLAMRVDPLERNDRVKLMQHWNAVIWEESRLANPVSPLLSQVFMSREERDEFRRRRRGHSAVLRLITGGAAQEAVAASGYELGEAA